MKPLMSERNFTPTVIAAPSRLFGPTVTVEGHSMHGQLVAAGAPTVTETPDDGDSMFRLSSVARLRMLTVPCADGVHRYDQFPRPFARCHVAPPSRDTSTPPTTPPPASVAEPLIVICVPLNKAVDTGG